EEWGDAAPRAWRAARHMAPPRRGDVPRFLRRAARHGGWTFGRVEYVWADAWGPADHPRAGHPHRRRGARRAWARASWLPGREQPGREAARRAPRGAWAGDWPDGGAGAAGEPRRARRHLAGRRHRDVRRRGHRDAGGPAGAALREPRWI